MISNGEPKGIQPFFVSHVVPSDPTFARGREERGRTERRGGKKKQPETYRGGKWRKKRQKKRGEGI